MKQEERTHEWITGLDGVRRKAKILPMFSYSGSSSLVNYYALRKKIEKKNK